MDVVLNEIKAPAANTPLSDKSSKRKEAGAETADTLKKSDTSSIPLSITGTSPKTEEPRPENSDNKQVKSVENKIVSNENLIQYSLEEVEDAKTGKTTRELVVYLKDKETGEIIRRIPPEEYNDPYKKYMPGKGVFIDQNG